MPLKRSHSIAIITIVGLMVISAAVLRFIPTDSPKSLNSMTIEDQTSDLLELTDKSVPLALNNSTLFVLDFYYPGCRPCRFLNNTTSELSRELEGQVQFGRMNVRNKENSNTVKAYKISSYPTLLIFDEGVLISRLKGNISKSELLAELKDIYPGLDDAKVCLPPSNQTAAESLVTAKSATAEPAAQKTQGKAIPLIKLGTKNSDQAMLITDETMDSAMSQYEPMLAVVTFSETCSFCSLLNITIAELARELQGQVAFGLIDTKTNKDTEAKYNATRVPTMLIFKDGKLAGKIVGNKKKEVIVANLKKIEPKLNISKVALPPPPPKPTPEQVCVNMTKSDQPLLQAFVVSRCPFGLQMQRIMADIIDEAGETGKYMKVMYLGSVDSENNTITAMHGEVEAQENLRQICIREEQPDKYWDYVRCYMNEGNTAECLQSTSIDVDELDSCTNDSSLGLVYAQEDFDLASEFKITGSPTMLMNNEIVKESNFATNTTNGRSPQAVKELLCCGFKEEPSFCSRELNESRAATMFSTA